MFLSTTIEVCFMALSIIQLIKKTPSFSLPKKIYVPDCRKGYWRRSTAFVLPKEVELTGEIGGHFVLRAHGLGKKVITFHQ